MGGVFDYEKLKEALLVSDEQFASFFPGLSWLKKSPRFTFEQRETMMQTIRSSAAYRRYILDMAAEKRPDVISYFRQEMNFEETFAFVEYWGRGYTQTCHTRLLQAAAGSRIPVPYYYARSIYPTQGDNIRYQFTVNDTPLLFTEALFANIPYQSVEGYTRVEGRVQPVMKEADCNRELFESMEKMLPLFAEMYAGLPFLDEEKITRDLFEFSLEYYAGNPTDPVFLTQLAPLQDAHTIQGKTRPFAPPVNGLILDDARNRRDTIHHTSSIEMSLASSKESMIRKYRYMKDDLPAVTQKLREKEREQDSIFISICNKQERGYLCIKSCWRMTRGSL